MTVKVVKEQDATAAVWVVFDRCDLCWDPVLVPAEVDLAVLLLVATTAVAAGLATVAVATTGTRLALEQRLFWCRLGDFREVGGCLEATSWTCWLTFTKSHGSSHLEQVDFVTIDERDHCSLGIWALAERSVAAVALALSLTVQRVHLVDLDLKEGFDGLLDFRLRRIGSNGEGVNVLFEKGVALLGNDRGDEYICLLYTSPSPRDQRGSRMPSSA